MKRELCVAVAFALALVSGVAGADDPRLVVESGGHHASIWKIHFTSDGRYLVSAGYDKVVRVWDTRTGEIARTIRGEIGDGLDGSLFAAALSADDRYLAVGGWLAGSLPDRDAVRVHDFKTGEVKALFWGHANVVQALAFSRDGKHLASGSADHTIRVWDMDQLRDVHVLKGHTDQVAGLDFSPDGRRLVSGGFDDTVRLWEVSSGMLIKPMKGHTDDVYAVAFSPDGRYIASGSKDTTIRLWDAMTGDPVKVLATQGRNVTRLAFSPDGKLLLTGAGRDGSGPLVSNVFSVPEGQLVASFDRHDYMVSAVAISPDGKTAATAGGGNRKEIYLWDLRTGTVVRELVGQGRSVFSVGFARDGRSIAFGQDSRPPNASGPLQQVVHLGQDADDEVGLGGDAVNQAAYLRAVARAGDQELEIKDGGLATLRIIRRGQVVREVTRDPTTGARHLGYTLTGDGRYVISGGDGGRLTVYRAETGTEARALVGHTASVWAVAVSPDNRTVVSGSDDQTVRLWDLESGRNLLTIFVGTDREWVAWTPNGYYTSSVKGDRYIGWHLNQGVDQAAKFYAGVQFQNELYRPDIVTEYLQSRSIDAAVRRANARRGGAFRGQVAVTPADLRNILPPLIHVITPDEEELVAASDTVTVKAVALAHPNTLPVTDVKVFLNGALVAGAQAGQARGASYKREVELDLTLEAGVNTLTIIASNDRATSMPTFRRIRYTGTTERPDLILLTIGVSEYKDPKVAPLEFAHADAIEVDKVFALQAGRAFRNVKRKTLTNRQATRIEIIKALKWLRTEGTQNDYRLLFLSGHAGIDRQGHYYFFSHEHEPDEDWELYSINFSVISERLSGSGKAILMVDTCRAAAVAGGGRSRGDTNFDEILKRMVDDYRGLVIFSAATGREVSVERREWGHGAFTKALLEGLAGQADGYGGVPDGSIETKELGSWIIDRVKVLTKGEQHATHTQPPGLPSFPLVQLK